MQLFLQSRCPNAGNWRAAVEPSTTEVERYRNTSSGTSGRRSSTPTVTFDSPGMSSSRTNEQERPFRLQVELLTDSMFKSVLTERRKLIDDSRATLPMESVLYTRSDTVYGVFTVLQKSSCQLSSRFPVLKVLINCRSST